MQKVMKQWANITNCKDYAPYFILFLDCVHQLINMNPFAFEFTSHYLASIGYNLFTNRYCELVLPIPDDV
jgi:hypothetical protein